MPLQIKRVIETFATEGAQVALCIAMTFHMSIQKPLQGEDFVAHPAHELGRIGFRPGWWQSFIITLQCRIGGHWILNSVTAIDQLNRHIRWNSKL